MSLNSISFIIVVALLLLLMFLIQLGGWMIQKSFNDHRVTIQYRIQMLIILIFSYFCICINDIRFGIVIASLTVITYLLGILVDKADGKIKQVGLFAGIALCITDLCYFKYSDFFINNIMLLVGKDKVAVNIIIPIGISFYSMSLIGYMVDIYKGRYRAEKNILNFAIFVSFFPKITAGPIVRGIDFLPQIQNYQGLKKENVLVGIQIFTFGLFKKIVLADRLGVFVDDVFLSPNVYHTGTVVIAVLSYSMQIYLDFSGYSDMAIGISKVFGFDFSANFNVPYIASNVSEFWKRWHISLSSWFKDYLYIPLGGNRKNADFM